MSRASKIGKVTHGETEIVWKIENMSSVFNKNESYCWTGPTFSFADSSWYFHLQYKYPPGVEHVFLFLHKGNITKHSIEYDFALKRVDGYVEHVGRGIFEESKTGWSKCYYIMKVSEFIERQSQLVVSDVLTVTSSLRSVPPPSSQPRMLDTKASKRKKLIEFNTLSKNFKDAFDNKESCDTILRVQDKEYEVHKFVLMVRSPVFAAMFKHDTKETQTGDIHIYYISDCDPDSFKEFLEYLYSGKLEEPSSDSLVHLYKTSDKYNVPELKAFCVEYLMENLTPESFIKVVILAENYEEKELLIAAQNFFNLNCGKIFDTTEWEHFLKDNNRLANKLLKEMAIVKTEK